MVKVNWVDTLCPRLLIEAPRTACTAMLPSSLAILVCLAASLLAQPAVGLSYSVCDTILEEYTTAAPRLEGTWPYYSLLYTCVATLPLYSATLKRTRPS